MQASAFPYPAEFLFASNDHPRFPVNDRRAEALDVETAAHALERNRRETDARRLDATLTEELRRLPVSGPCQAHVRCAGAESRTRETLHVTNGNYAERACGFQRGNSGLAIAEPNGLAETWTKPYARLDDE